MMLFSKKKITVEYAVEQCTKCGAVRRRKFRPSDVLFAASECGSCGAPSRIEKIFGQTLER